MRTKTPPKKTGAQLVAIVRRYFPSVTDEEAIDMLWNHSAYPFTGDGRHYVAAMRRLRSTLDAGKTPCDTCSRATTTHKWTCNACWNATHTPAGAVSIEGAHPENTREEA